MHGAHHQKLYPGREEKIAGLQRHLTFFNTNPNVGTVIHGAVVSMEEERANGAEISDEAINAVKTGMMGPMAGIGDALDQGVIIPLVVALGISFGSTGNLFGPLLVLIGLPIILMLIAYNCWMKGYSLGSSAISAMLAGGRMKQLIGAAGILGCTVMGGLGGHLRSASRPPSPSTSESRPSICKASSLTPSCRAFCPWA